MRTPETPSTTAITSPTPRVRRARRLRTAWRLSGPQDEPDAADRVQDAGLAELASQVPDENVGHVGLGVEVVAPDLLVQPLAGDHLAGMAHEDAEQLELPSRELEVAPASQRAVARQVEL